MEPRRSDALDAAVEYNNPMLGTAAIGWSVTTYHTFDAPGGRHTTMPALGRHEDHRAGGKCLSACNGMINGPEITARDRIATWPRLLHVSECLGNSPELQEVESVRSEPRLQSYWVAFSFSAGKCAHLKRKSTQSPHTRYQPLNSI